MNREPRINGHGHLLPYPHQLPSFLKEKEILWVDEDRKFMRRNGWSRPVTDQSFFLNEKLEWMDRNNIDHEVILNLTQLYGLGLSKDLCVDVIRFQNDFNGELQRDYNTKFTSGFVLPLPFIEESLEELNRSVDNLNLRVLCLPSHYLDKNGNWKSVADEELLPLWEEINRLKLAVEIHPPDDQRLIPFEDRFWRFHLVWMCAFTADTFHLFTSMGFYQKFSQIRTCFAHGNQYGQMNLGRRIQGFEGRPDLFTEAVSPKYSVGSKNIFFDSLLHDVDSLELLIKRNGSRQLLVGIDDPYPLGEMENINEGYPGKIIDEAESTGLISKQEKQLIWWDNCLNWLGEKRKEELSQ